MKNLIIISICSVVNGVFGQTNGYTGVSWDKPQSSYVSPNYEMQERIYRAQQDQQNKYVENKKIEINKKIEQTKNLYYSAVSYPIKINDGYYYPTVLNIDNLCEARKVKVMNSKITEVYSKNGQLLTLQMASEIKNGKCLIRYYDTTGNLSDYTEVYFIDEIYK